MKVTPMPLTKSEKPFQNNEYAKLNLKLRKTFVCDHRGWPHPFMMAAML